jgi:ribonucleoside-diphosphate reductase alpha chain
MSKRPNVLEGKTIKKVTGCGPVYITINEYKNQMFEVWGRMGKGGGCASTQIESICVVISFALQAGVEPAKLVKKLNGIICHSPCGMDEKRVTSCADAIAQCMRDFMLGKEEPQKVEEKKEV